MPDEDTSLKFSGDIKFSPPEVLYAIEVYDSGSWLSVTIGDGIRVTVAGKERADKIIVKFRQIHIAKGKKIPVFRSRQLTIEETSEAIKQHLRHGQDGKFGTDLDNTLPPHDLVDKQ